MHPFCFGGGFGLQLGSAADRTFLGPPAADCNDGTPAPKKGKGKGGKSKEPESTDRKMTSFYFGDFNFRLALNDLVGHVTNGARARFEREKGTCTRPGFEPRRLHHSCTAQLLVGLSTLARCDGLMVCSLKLANSLRCTTAPS